MALGRTLIIIAAGCIEIIDVLSIYVYGTIPCRKNVVKNAELSVSRFFRGNRPAEQPQEHKSQDT